MKRPDMAKATADQIIEYVELEYGRDEEGRVSYARQAGALQSIVGELVRIRDQLADRELSLLRDRIEKEMA